MSSKKPRVGRYRNGNMLFLEGVPPIKLTMLFHTLSLYIAIPTRQSFQMLPL